MSPPVAGRVSIVIPCHEAAPFVGEAIESALGQSYPEVEVIVVDDASSDQGWEVVTAFGDRIQALRLPERAGPGRARNQGAARATGDRLLFLDADDRLAPDTVAPMVAASGADPSALVRCGWRWLDGRGGPGRAPRSEDPLVAWLEGDWGPPAIFLWPRQVFHAVGGWSEDLLRNADGELAMRAFAMGTPVVRSGGDVLYRRHPSQWSLRPSNLGEPGLRSILTVMIRVSAVLEQRGVIERYRPALDRAYAEQAAFAFRAGYPAVGWDCLSSGGEGARRLLRPKRLAGRLAVALLGLAATERLRGWMRG